MVYDEDGYVFRYLRFKEAWRESDEELGRFERGGFRSATEKVRALLTIFKSVFVAHAPT